MLENLKKLAQEVAQNAIVNNNAVPNEKNDEAINAASGSIIETLKQQLTSGNLSNLVDTFKSGHAENSAVAEEASNTFVNKLSAMGIDSGTAKSIASSVIPAIIGKFVNKTNDPNDSSFDLKDIMGKVLGPDGKFQLSDLTNLLGSNDKDSSADDILGKIKGFFK